MPSPTARRQVVKVSQFHRVALWPAVKDSGHEGSEQDARQQEPATKRHSDHEYEHGSDREQSTHDAATNGDPMHGNSGMTFQVPQRSV
jgi:hypothetical protein